MLFKSFLRPEKFHDLKRITAENIAFDRDHCHIGLNSSGSVELRGDLHRFFPIQFRRKNLDIFKRFATLQTAADHFFPEFQRTVGSDICIPGAEKTIITGRCGKTALHSSLSDCHKSGGQSDIKKRFTFQSAAVGSQFFQETEAVKCHRSTAGNSSMLFNDRHFKSDKCHPVLIILQLSIDTLSALVTGNNGGYNNNCCDNNCGCC